MDEKEGELGTASIEANGALSFSNFNGGMTSLSYWGGGSGGNNNKQPRENEKSNPLFTFGTQHGVPYVEVSFLHGGAITPGPFVIYPKGGAKDPYYYTHEPGHVLQFMLLGSLYYPLVAIPSFFTATFFQENHKQMLWEKSANQLWYWATGENDQSNPLYTTTKK